MAAQATKNVRLMADIFLHFKNKFARNPELIASDPLVHQSLERTYDEEIDYEQWKDSNSRLAILDWLRDQFMVQVSAPHKTHDGIDFFSSSNTKGFTIHPALTRFSDNNVKHLFNYLKEQLSRADYKVSLSDSRIYGRGFWNETNQRHILKPLREEPEEFTQVILELTLKNESLVNLKVTACIPNTDFPRSTDDFVALMETLLV